MARQLIKLTLVILVSSVWAFAQGAHYTYPFSVECPDSLVSSGEVVGVKAKFEGGHTGDSYSPTYTWYVSQGTVASGQGTPSITVEIGRSDAGTLTVTLERSFSQAHYPLVQKNASCSIAIAPIPKPRLSDEFRTRGSNCEEGFARLDTFFVEINNNPADEAVIVLYGDTSKPNALRKRERELLNHFTFRKFPRDRVRLVRGIARENGTTQFWLVPPGAEPPMIERAPETIEKPPTEPYLYGASYNDGVPGCSGHIYDLAEYARELRSQPRSKGRIVINEASRAKFNRELAVITRELAVAGIPRSRFTAIYKYVRPNRMLELNELWVIPASSR